MSFRRSKNASARKQSFDAWVWQHRSLIHALDIPESVIATQREFDLFLMHGVSTSGFSLEWPELDRPTQERLIELVGSYWQAGFEDPGIGVIAPDALARVTGALPGD
ncbi:MAG: hypothetical protein AAF735_03990 [Myxococcota bacterium]